MRLRHGCPLVLLSALPGQTVLLDIDPRPGVSSSPGNVVKSGNRIFFNANDGISGRELWVSDGTAAGTRLAVDLVPGPGSGGAQNLVAVAGGVAFRDSLSTQPNALYFSDGTGGGTAILSTPEIYGTGYYLAGGDRSTLYFIASTQAGANGEVFMRTAAGSVSRVTDFYGADPYSSAFYLAAVQDQRAWISVINATGAQLWIHEPGNLRRVSFPAGTAMPNATIAGVELNGRLYFAGMGDEPWEADPTTNTARRLGDLNPGSAGSSPARFVALGNDIVFTAFTAATGQELFKYQPNAPAPVLVADVFQGAQSGVAAWPLVVSGSTLYFAGYTFAAGEELWRSDGTAQGTSLVRDLEPGQGWGSPAALVAATCDNGSALFGGFASAHGRELWLTNGTAAGTRLLFDLVPGSGSGLITSTNRWMTLLGTTWIFAGTTAATGDELFVVDAGVLRTPCTTCPVAGCPGTNGIPSLSSVGQPTLGNAAFAVRLQNACGLSVALLLLDGPGSPTSLPGSCTLFTGATPRVFIQPTDGAGGAVQGLPVPNDPGLLGATLRSQWAVVDPSGAFLQTVSFSNGCFLVLGS